MRFKPRKSMIVYNIKVAKEDINKLQEVFGKDIDLMLFYVTWIKNGLNATKAYKELHPEVGDHSANTLGSRMLSKVDKTLILQAYGLDVQLYMQQLKDGLSATKRDHFSGEIEDDHKTRKDYHDKLGKLLNIEQDAKTNVNILNQGGDMTLEFIGRNENNTA
jgi:hypothetical protein